MSRFHIQMYICLSLSQVFKSYQMKLSVLWQKQILPRVIGSKDKSGHTAILLKRVLNWGYNSSAELTWRYLLSSPAMALKSAIRDAVGEIPVIIKTYILWCILNITHFLLAIKNVPRLLYRDTTISPIAHGYSCCRFWW